MTQGGVRYRIKPQFPGVKGSGLIVVDKYGWRVLSPLEENLWRRVQRLKKALERRSR